MNKWIEWMSDYYCYLELKLLYFLNWTELNRTELGSVQKLYTFQVSLSDLSWKWLYQNVKRTKKKIFNY